LPEEDTEERARYNPETFVAFQLIQPEEFKVDREKPVKSQPTYLTKDEVEMLRNKSNKPASKVMVKSEKIQSKGQNKKPVENPGHITVAADVNNKTQQSLLEIDTPIVKLDKAIAEGKLKEAAQLAKEVSKSDITSKLSTNPQKKISKSEDIRYIFSIRTVTQKSIIKK